MDQIEAQPTNSPWPNRMAIVLACATFPLIWVGGLVTTYDAGMAVPDWPGTFGYNLFAYPISTWIGGPFDVFVEHGHRLLGALAGILTIGLVAITFRCEQRSSVRTLAIVCLIGVISQGLLGGIRVLLNEVAFARIHGISGPLFFCLTVAMVVVTSSSWRTSRPDASPEFRKLTAYGCTLTGLVFVQLVLGAHLRHLPVDMQPRSFSALALGHILVAIAILGQVAFLAIHFFKNRKIRNLLWLRTAVICVICLISLQVVMGVSTWLVKYGWPIWLPSLSVFEGYTVIDNSMVQALVTTGHVAIGSLLLVTSLFLALRCCRIALPRSRKRVKVASQLSKLEVVL